MALSDWSFNANEGDSPASMEMRRKIALQLVANSGKRGYPKNIGEGLASMGDSIGEALMMRDLAKREATYRAAQEADLASQETGGATAATTGPRAEADVPDTTDTTEVRGRVAAITPTPPDLAAPPVVAAAPPVTRSLTPVAEAPPPDAPIRTNPNGTIAGNITAPTTPPMPPAPPPAAAPYEMRAGVPYSMWGGVTPEQNPALAAGLQAAAARLQSAPSASAGPADGRRSDLGNPVDGGIYPPTASLDASSGTLPVGRGAPQRDAIARLLTGGSDTLGGPGVPQPNPTSSAVMPPTPLTAAAAGSPPEAAGNRPIVMPDVKPQPAAPAPVPGAQLAQALPSQMPPQVPPPGTRAPPVPDPEQEPRVAVPSQFAQPPQRPADPVEPPKTPRQIYNERVLHAFPDDPVRSATATRIIADEEKLRQDEYNRRVEKWKSDTELYRNEYGKQQEFQRGAPQRELELQKAEDERQQRNYTEKINRMLGGIPQETFIANLNKGKENIAGIPAATDSIRRARDLVDKMYHGPFADSDTFLAKVMGSAGFPLDPKASATEQFKTAMTGVMAQARKAIVGPGAQSEGELALLQKSTAADAKLTPETIRATLDAAERLNLKVALNHQQLVRRFAGEDDPQRQAMVYGAYGVPNMVDLVPQAHVNKLFKNSDNADAHREFDNLYHTPGLSRDVMRYRKPQ
jgi:hypothetical protein